MVRTLHSKEEEEDGEKESGGRVLVGQKQQQMGVTASFYDWARTKGQFNSTDEREREREKKTASESSRLEGGNVNSKEQRVLFRFRSLSLVGFDERRKSYASQPPRKRTSSK